VISLAQTFADHGVRVFPCKEFGASRVVKSPYTPNGFKDASTDIDQIGAWWNSWPGAIVGLPCRLNDIVVLDGDRHDEHDGVAALENIFAEIDFDTATIPVVETPNNGKHFYFRRPQGSEALSNPPKGVDIKDNGYVVAPGSRFADGREYRLLNGTPEQLASVIRDKTLPELPPALLARLTKDRGPGARISAPTMTVTHQPTFPIDRETLLARLSDKRRDDLDEKSEDRSDHFHKVTGWLKGDGFSETEAAQIWELFPNGAASKYLENGKNLIVGEVHRSWGKVDDEPPPPIETVLGGNLLSRFLEAKREFEAARSAITPVELPVFDASELADQPIPPREWHVADVLPAKQVSLLYGDGGTGKSLLAAQLAASTVLGRPWIGIDVRQGDVLFLTAEDDRDEVHRRLADIVRAEGVTLADLRGLAVCSLADADAVLAVPEPKTNVVKATKLYATVERHIQASRPALVILDTLADIFGGDENNRTQARQFIALLRRLAIQYRTTILVLAHPSLAGINSGAGTSGSTGWSNSGRGRLYFERANENPDPDLRVLKIMKTNYGRIGRKISVQWESGRFVYVSEQDATPQATSQAEQDVEQLFMSLLAKFTTRGLTVGIAKNNPRHYAPNLFASDPEGKNCGKRGFENAMDRLLTKGLIRHGKEPGVSRSRAKTIIVAAELPLERVQNPRHFNPSDLQNPLHNPLQ
jgi:RecA-family ATPase